MQTPLFHVPVPVVAHELADPEKGTGIAMICTFGDVTDVTWWRAFDLPTRIVIRRDGTIAPGRFGEEGWESLDAAAANASMGELAGKGAKQARRRIVELLTASGDLRGDPEPIRHPVKFYENGDRPLEVIASRQWFVKTLDFRDALLARGRELQLAPVVHGRPLHQLGRGLESGLGDQPTALLRRARSPCGIRSMPTGSRATTSRSSPTRRTFRSIRRTPRRPASRTTSGADPAGSSATRM